METLFSKHDRCMRITTTKLARDMMDETNWDTRLICLQGPRGVGKSTLLRQYIKLHYPLTRCTNMRLGAKR